MLSISNTMGRASALVRVSGARASRNRQPCRVRVSASAGSPTPIAEPGGTGTSLNGTTRGAPEASDPASTASRPVEDAAQLQRVAVLEGARNFLKGELEALFVTGVSAPLAVHYFRGGCIVDWSHVVLSHAQ